MSSRWFLNWTGATATAPNGDGRPWGDGSGIAARQAAGGNPWDEDCTVKVLFGMEAMTAMADSLQAVIAQAKKRAPFDKAAGKWVNGHVYIAHWRFNCLRDLSTTNAWTTNPWNSADKAALDQTSIGLVLKLMQAGIQVRLMLWYPTWAGEKKADLGPHIEDHFFAARIVEAENERLMKQFEATAKDAPPLGVLALDMRTAGLPAAAHHQKIMIVRTPWRDVGFCGGVDLAYTRRDAPVLDGDWQSGLGILTPSPTWPRETGVVYESVDRTTPPASRQTTDLPPQVYGADRQMWHDQHLQLEGDVVQSLEWNFVERWSLSGRVFDLSKPRNKLANQVIFSTPRAIKDNAVTPLPDPRPIARTALTRTAVALPKASVQMWRTIPLHSERTSGRHQRGEFTAMYGISEACLQASELIWIFEQYLWSRAFGRLLHRRLLEAPNLHVVIVLPPHADVQEEDAHKARRLAISSLVGDPPVPSVAARVNVYSTWHRKPPNEDRGIYVHAKVQMFDADLLVCGSTNLNRRSFLCDTEISFAVADANLLHTHQQKLWSYVVPADSFPALDRTKPGWGKVLFNAIARASRVSRIGDVSAESRLILDPWQPDTSTLPNGAQRRVTSSENRYAVVYNNGLDPSSVDRKVELPVKVKGKPKRDADLADIASRLEHEFVVRKGKAVFPYRVAAAYIRVRSA